MALHPAPRQRTHSCPGHPVVRRCRLSACAAQDRRVFIRRSLAINPSDANAHSNLANVLSDTGRLDEAIESYRRAIALKPHYAQAHNNLGIALANKGDIDEAILAYRQAIALQKDYADAMTNLAVALGQIGLADEAASTLHRAIEINPNSPQAHINLGNVLRDQGKLDQALDAFQRAIALVPRLAEAYSNLGVTLVRDGRLTDGLNAFRRAIELKPSYFQAHSNLIYTLHFEPGWEPATLLQEHQKWSAAHTDPFPDLTVSFPNDRNPTRRLKIGYVSPDFHEHCQSLFTTPLFANHDKHQVEIYCYSSTVGHDAITNRLQSHADHWHECAGLSDTALSQLIRADQIDILIDLTMHMAGAAPSSSPQTAPHPGRLARLPRYHRPFHHRLSPHRSQSRPARHRRIRLHRKNRPPPRHLLVLRPPHSYPAARRLPLHNPGHITFGCLNNFTKVNDHVLNLWAHILNKAPESHLLLLAPAGNARQRILNFLSTEGIDPSESNSSTSNPCADYLHTFHRIDLSLDTFPYNGHTTSLDSLWMGVPILSLADGKLPVARAGISILSNLAMTELLAKDQNEFIQIAVALSQTPAKLAQLRANLRQRMQESPLMNAPRFARSIESAFCQMWQTWCESPAPLR